MNYGKLTAGTTKTAIDTAKPSEKGEIITYLSRMGDVLKPVFDTRHIVVGAVGVDGVKVVVDGNIADTVFWKSEVDIQPGQRGITPKSGKVFRQHYYYFSRFDFRQHLLKAGAVIVGAAVPVIYEKGRVGKAVFFGVAEQDVFLIGDGITIALVGVLLRKSAV